MHIETLRIFCDLADSRSFSKTAEKHLLSQSAISQQLAQLELAHKCQLVTRKKRPIEMTHAGQFFYKAARDILERYDQLKSELSTLKATTENRINIAAIFSIGMHSLPDYIKKFMVSYPNVNVVIAHFGSFLSKNEQAHQQTIWMARQLPNVYLDTSGVMRFSWLEEALRECGPQKLVFGSDGPVVHCAPELEKIRVLKLPQEDLDKVLGGNIIRLANLKM